MVITIEDPNKYFQYVDGTLYWKVKKSNCINIGDVAGSKDRDGYLLTRLNGKTYRNHRVIYAMHHGEWPELVDHIDGDILNNRIENLRKATASQNSQNRKINNNNTSGIKGVNFDKRTKSWKAMCMANGKRHLIGYFKELPDADKALREFRNINHGIFSRHY
jgi:hypothetical protein